jgi:hypothetical protein
MFLLKIYIFLAKSKDGGVRVGGLGRGQGEEVAPTMYTHMNKCKNNKKILDILH